MPAECSKREWGGQARARRSRSPRRMRSATTAFALRPERRAAKMPAMFRPQDLLDLAQFQFPELFDDCENAWDALKKIADFTKDGKIVGKGTVIEEGATIK